MQEFLQAIVAGAPSAELEAIPLPSHFRAAYLRREDAKIFDGMASKDKDPRRTIKIGEIPTPELAPDEVFVAVMASSINFNTVWSSIFEPLSTFSFLDRLGRSG